MVGCMMAMHRNTFIEMGAYDKGMEVWGGENIELPIRVSVYDFQLQLGVFFSVLKYYVGIFFLFSVSIILPHIISAVDVRWKGGDHTLFASGPHLQDWCRASLA